MHHLTLDSPDTTIKLKLLEVTKAIYGSKKMVVLTGAGISCNAGIPDFRSAHGLYNANTSTTVKGKDLFDISLFRNEDTLQAFASFMETLYGHTTQAMPTETHKFIHHLKKHNKLLRCYTQNIDALERKLELHTGIIEAQTSNFRKHWKDLDVVQLHGDLHALSCTACFAHFDWSADLRVQLAAGEIPECPKCLENYHHKSAEGKRLSSLTVGMLRPTIVLYGENHPHSESISRGISMDIRSRPDCLVIFGTSLRVDGVKKLVKTMAKEIHDRNGKVIFVNKTSPSHAVWGDFIDYFIESDCDSWIRSLKQDYPDLFLTQLELDQLKLKKSKGKKKQMMLTPPPTPSTNKKFDVGIDPKSIKSNDKIKQLLGERALPEYSPIKTNRIIDLSDEELDVVKQELKKKNPLKQINGNKNSKRPTRPLSKVSKDLDKENQSPKRSSPKKQPVIKQRQNIAIIPKICL